MADELADFWVHEVTVTPLTGTGAYGPVYGAPVLVTGFLEEARKLVRDQAGAEVVSEASFRCALAHADALPPGSRVDVGDRQATVIARARHTAPGLDLPEHLEVALS